MSCRAVLAVCSSNNISGHQTQGGEDIKEPFSGESLCGFVSVNSMVVWVSLLPLVMKHRVAQTLMGKECVHAASGEARSYWVVPDIGSGGVSGNG
jgi:hypothetical protein